MVKANPPVSILRSHGLVLLVLAISAISALYWFLFALNAYNAFHEYADLGFFAYNMWYDLHYTAAVSGLQFLVFANHIAPDQLLVLPFFYLNQSSMTLLLIQDLFLAATGVIIFFVSRDLLKNGRYAFLLFIAYIINPGMHGMLIFDYHAEAFITAFYVLTFYFYMKNRAKPFFVSLVLLLGTMEVAPPLALTLGIGLFVYDYFYSKKSESRVRIKLAVGMIAASILALLFYSSVTGLLASNYSAGAYPSLPPYLQVISIMQNQISQLGYFNLNLAVSLITSPAIAYGLLLVILGFGLASVFDPVILVIVISPWLFQAVLVGYAPFFLIYYQYFGFVLGACFVATILGIILAREKRTPIPFLLSRSMTKKRYAAVYKALVYSTILFAVIFLLASPVFVKSVNVNNLTEDFLFQANATQVQQMQQLDSMINVVPENASLMTTYFIYPHVIQRKELETLSNDTYFFKPDYVLVDFDEYGGENDFKNSQYQYLNNFMNENAGEYVTYATNGSAVLLKRI